MTLAQKMLIIWALAAAIAVVVLQPWRSAGTPEAGQTRTSARVLRIFVAVIAGALVVVGVVSNTPIIHAVQITPLVVVLVLFSWKPGWSVIAAVHCSHFGS